MKFNIEIEVTPESCWLNGETDLLKSVYLKEDPETLINELVWRRIGDKEPYFKIIKVKKLA